MNMNMSIRQAMKSAIATSKRPLNSRKIAKAMSARFGTPIHRVYGNLSWLSRTHSITWVAKRKGGPSFLK